MSLNKEGIKNILEKLTDAELSGLANTVTQGLLRNMKNTREDAYDCIIKYSCDNQSFLRRKVITREILFSYLDDNNVPVQTPFTKSELIQKILTFWNCNYNYNSNDNAASIIEEEAIAEREEAGVIPDISKLATKFAEWFYNMLNANEPIGIEHFWPDCKLKMKLPTEIIEISDKIIDITDALYKIKTEHHLFFNPNLTTDGTQGKIDMYGLVLVLSCGTLHVKNEIVGVYEQVFSLARDPSAENNWKIKSMQINLVSNGSIVKPPSLTDNELTASLLSLPDV